MPNNGSKKAGEAERQIGMELFLTLDKGLGGRLRAEPEDFVVQELSMMPPEDPAGLNTAALVRSRCWETNRLVREFARWLHSSRNKVMFAGTKDRRAVTTQLFVFGAPVSQVRNISLADVDFLRIYPTSAQIGLGDLLGNGFSIVLRDMEINGVETAEICNSVQTQLEELGGFPNFFGVQRFGAARPITHTVGKLMTKREPEKAVIAYLCQSGEYEGEAAAKARKRLASEMDFRQALQYFPKELTFEKALLNYLVREPDDFTGAFGELPRNLLMMFIHAYQSFLFNRMLSERMRRGLPLNAPTEGDIVLKVDKNGLPDHENWVRAEARNIPKLTELVGRKKAFVSIALYGMESELAGGEPGEIEARILEEEGVKSQDFVLAEYDRLGSKGTRREILAPFSELKIAQQPDSVRFDFNLTKGCYATTLLREFMKANELTKY